MNKMKLIIDTNVTYKSIFEIKYSITCDKTTTKETKKNFVINKSNLARTSDCRNIVNTNSHVYISFYIHLWGSKTYYGLKTARNPETILLTIQFILHCCINRGLLGY